MDPIVCKFGSHLYGKTTAISDKDIYCISDEASVPYEVISSKGVDCHYVSSQHFQEMLDKHDIAAMEVYSSEQHIQSHFKFDFDQDKLRRSISAVVSNSWVKAKKKMAQGDDYIGRKSMWHSLRILMFGIQIAKHKKVVDFQEANCYYDDIVLSGKPYDELKETYHPIMKAKQTEFRILCPKEL